MNRTTLPLTQNQLAIWLDELLFPGTDAYHIGAHYSIKGNLDVPKFQNAIERVIEENDAFGFSVQNQEDKTFQVLQKSTKYQTPFYDFSDEDNPHKYCLTRIKEHFNEPFDLANDQLFDFPIIKAGEEEYYWVMKIHHLIIDGWGYSVFIQKVAAYYNEQISDTLPKPKETFDYKEYVEAELAYMDSERFETDKQYWLDKFKDLPPTYREAQDPKEAKKKILPMSQKQFVIKRKFYNKIVDFTKENRVSSFHFFLGIFATYIYRTTGQQKICIGVPILNRSNFKEKNTIGMFTGISPLLIQIEENETFESLLLQIKNTLRLDFRHQRFPFNELLRLLNNQTLGERQLFDMTFSYMKQNHYLVMEGVETKFFMRRGDFSKTSIDIWLEDVVEEKDVVLSFYTLAAYFPDWEIDRIMSRFEVMMTEVLEDWEQPLNQIKLKPDAEEELLLNTFNNNKKDFPKDKLILDLFKEQVQSTPNKAAAVFKGKTLSYDELDKLSDNLACLIKEKLTSAKEINEIAVPILMSQSLEVLVSFLAVLKVGGVITPVNYFWPEKMIREVLQSLKAPLILVDEAFENRVSEISISQIQKVELSGLSFTPQRFVSNRKTLSDSVYLIHTSGSTGKPKGVLVPYRGLMNRLFWMNDYFGKEAAQSVLQTTKHMFDSVMWQFFWPLMNGGKVVIPEPDTVVDLSYLKRQITKNQITLTDFVPSLFEEVVRELSDKKPALDSLKHIIIGGEKINRESTFRFMENYPEIRMTNLYGPTEASIGCIAYEVENKSSKTIPIGKPIANVQVYIVDKMLNPVPIGIEGEILLGGECLAEGYFNKPDLTTEKFIPNPFKKGERLYKTGDLAKWLPDGNIEFLGRIDYQLKIRGYRIEAGEIEQALLAHPIVESVTVIDCELKTGKELAAYFTVPEKMNLDVAELRSFLSLRLPVYMIPSYFVELENLPLTPGGKVNRKALPLPLINASTVNTDYVPGNSPVEKSLVKLWENVLETCPIGIHDNFFHIGGHSLKALRLVSKINSLFNSKIKPVQIFSYPTIAELALQIEESNWKSDRLGMRLNDKDGLKIFAFPDIFGSAIVFQNLAKLTNNASVYAFDYTGSPNILEEYYREIKAMQPEGSYRLMGYSAGGNLAYEMARYMEQKGEIISQLILFDSGIRQSHQIQSTTEITESIRTVLSHIKGDFSFSSIQNLLEEGFIEPQDLARMTTYTQFYNELVTRGCIKADIHLIASDDSKSKEEILKQWRKFTSGHFHIYHGKGAHFTMLKPPFLDRNVEILNRISGQIKPSYEMLTA